MKKNVSILFIPFVVPLMLLSCNSNTAPQGPEAETNVVAEKKVATLPEQEASSVDVSGGTDLYTQHCAACHQASGEGINGVFPPLKGADFLANSDKATIIKVALNGSKDADGNAKPITVNGTSYPGGAMMVNELPAEEGVEIVNYVLNSWGNNFGTVDVSEVELHD